MNGTYKPLKQMVVGLTDVGEIEALAMGCTHLETADGEVTPIRWWNKKSVGASLPPKGRSPERTRVEFNKIASFGILDTSEAGLSDENTEKHQIDPVESDTKTDTAENVLVTDTPNPPPATGHQARDHALLSASGAHRWINCPPSAVLEDARPDDAGDAADQGTAAHELAEHKLLRATKRRSDRPVSKWHDDDMEQHTDAYRDYVLGVMAEADGDTAQLFLEQRLDFSHVVPGGFGTGDAVVVVGETLHVIDLKYGAGVEVEASGNPQLRLYGLGALASFGFLFDIEQVKLHIYQPRRSNISSETLTVDELTQWAREVVEPAAQLAAAGEGDFLAGEWCQFCKLAATCRARADKHQADAALAFTKTDELTDTEIADIVQAAPGIIKWLRDVEKHATDQAVSQGKHWPGMKVVAGRSVRKYTDDQAVADAAAAAGYVDIWDKKLIGITAMERLMGKKEMRDVLGDLIFKPEGKPTLVPESDKRQALTFQTAEEAFS